MSLRDTIASLAYRTPPGKVDMPYFYTYDASSLTDGNNYQSPIVQMQNDSDFLLRRIVGMNLCLNPNTTGSFQIYDRGRRPLSQTAMRPGLLIDGVTTNGNQVVLPELLYTPSSQISFNLNGVLRNTTADADGTIYNSQIGFQGVRRFNESQFKGYQTRYKYRELPYTYAFTLTINWAHWTASTGQIINNVRTFNVPVLNTDFELCSIGVTYSNGQPVTTNDFRMTLYAADGVTRLSSAPINLPFFNYLAPKQYGQPVFPVPSLVWPRKGLITFDILSMLPFAGFAVKQYVVHFNGIWRVED